MTLAIIWLPLWLMIFPDVFCFNKVVCNLYSLWWRQVRASCFYLNVGFSLCSLSWSVVFSSQLVFFFSFFSEKVFNSSILALRYFVLWPPWHRYPLLSRSSWQLGPYWLHLPWIWGIWWVITSCIAQINLHFVEILHHGCMQCWIWLYWAING